MDDLTQKTNEELFALYKKERNPEIRRELTMRYLYGVGDAYPEPELKCHQ